jgi:hypothetical protein
MGVCRAIVLGTEVTVFLSLLGTTSILARVTLALVATSVIVVLAGIVVLSLEP